MSLTKKPLAAAACLALAGGGAGAAVLASTADAKSSSARHTSAVVQHGTGTGSVTITNAAGKTRTLTPAASCRLLKNGDYVLRLHGKKGDRHATGATHAKKHDGATAHGRKRHARRGERLVITGYHGAGTYTGVLHVSGRKGHTARHGIKVPVTLNSTGGSFSFTKTLSGKKDAALKGKTVSEKAAWSCTL